MPTYALFASLLPTTDTNRTTMEVALIGLLGGVVGYFLKYYLDKKQAFSSQNATIKREMYETYLKGLQRTTRKLTDLGPNPSATDVARISKEFGKLATTFYNTSILYGSPRVIRRYADFVRQTDKPQANKQQYELAIKSSRLYKAMRKDIGLGNWRLGRDGELLLRGNINDYDSTIRQYTRLHNRVIRWVMGK